MEGEEDEDGLRIKRVSKQQKGAWQRLPVLSHTARQHPQQQFCHLKTTLPSVAYCLNSASLSMAGGLELCTPRWVYLSQTSLVQPMSPCWAWGPAPPLLLPRVTQCIFLFYWLYQNSKASQGTHGNDIFHATLFPKNQHLLSLLWSRSHRNSFTGE